MNRVRAVAGLALFVLLAPAEVQGAGKEPPHWVVPAGQEERILSLVAPNRTLAPVLPGTWFDRIEITDDAIIFVVSGKEPPAGPVSIHLAWDSSAPSDKAPPPWHIDVKGEAETDAVAQSVALLRGRIEARLTRETYGSLLYYMADPGGDLRSGAWKWMERVAGTFGLVWRERRDRGLIQYTLRDVEVTAPAAPTSWILVSILALVAAGLVAGAGRLRRGVLDPGQPRTWWPLLAVAAAATLAVAAWWLRAPLSEAGTIVADQPPGVLAWLVPAHREFVVAQVFLLAACLLTVLGVVDVFRRDRGPGFGRILVETAGVGAVSFLIRLGMTAPNLFSQGAGGFDRLLRYVPGEGGMSLVAAWVLPDSETGFIWSAVGAAAGVAALGPPLLYLLGRSLRMSAAVSLLAGLAFACWPLHAVISSSDLLAGPVLAAGIAGWAFAAHAAQRDRPGALLPAAGLLAWAVWCRQDGLLVLLPAVGILLPSARRWSRRPELWGAVAWIGLALACRLLAWPGSSGPEPWIPGEAASSLGVAGYGMFPWWLVFVIPGVIASRRQRGAAVPAMLGFAAAVLSVLILRPLAGYAAWVEGGALAMPWIALLCGMGVDELAKRLPRPAVRVSLVAMIFAGVLMTPALHAGLLETRRGPAVSDRAFRDALEQVEARCGIVVAEGEGTVPGDPARRYRLIAWEEFERNPERPRGDQVLTPSTCSARKLSCWYEFGKNTSDEYVVIKISDKAICR